MSDSQLISSSTVAAGNEGTIPASDPRFSQNIGLITRAQGGDETAMEKLVLDNMGLVRTVAVKFRDRGTEFEDLMQIGTMGMIKAIHSFDTSRGTAFSTYAVVTPDGEWHEPGEMGWWGISFATDEEEANWYNEYSKFIDMANKNNYLVTIVDCHI